MAERPDTPQVPGEPPGPANRAPVDDVPPPGDPARYFDRQASELEYHARVLAMAQDESRPGLERLKFLAIFTELTDEFFRVRVAGLMEQRAQGVEATSRGGHGPAEQIAHLQRRFGQLAQLQAQILHESVLPALADEGVELVTWKELDAEHRRTLTEYFEEQVFPVLTPLAVGPAHPFPFISDLSLNLGVLVRHEPDGHQRFARVKVPPVLDRFVAVADGGPWLPLEELVSAHLERLLPGLEIGVPHTFRVTRNADYGVEDVDVEDLLDAVASELLERRFGHAVRLEVDPEVPEAVRELLCDELELDEADVLELPRPLALDSFWQLHGLDRPDLKDPPQQPRVPALFDQDAPGMFATLRDRDVLVQHPYDDFSASTQRFVELAARDPHVLAVKQTLYRTSGDSPIVRALVDAAESGKQAVALVELKARFDEAANIEWARKLEEAGVHVVYGFVELKTHTKTALVVRRDDDGTIRRYGHIGTGNYNPTTAESYEDIGLFTADAMLTADLSELFNFLTGQSQQQDYERLLVAPATLKDRILELIRDESHPRGRIVLKVNNLSHDEVIEALYDASHAGADIDLIVRSICCLRPGVAGLSERIRVRSVVGRYLEHSRVFRFGHEPQPGAYLIGSADLMPRNLERRVEAVAPVDDPGLRNRLDTILQVLLDDRRLSWHLRPDGQWEPVDREVVDGADAQERLAGLEPPS